MTNEGMDLLKEVCNLLLNADLNLSLIESDHLAASEEGLSAEIYEIRQEVVALSDKVSEHARSFLFPKTCSDSRFL